MIEVKNKLHTQYTLLDYVQNTLEKNTLQNNAHNKYYKSNYTIKFTNRFTQQTQLKNAQYTLLH